MHHNKFKKLSYLVGMTVLLLIPVLCAAAPTTGKQIHINLSQKIISISTFYNGTTLEVKGSVPEDNDALIVVSGHKHDVHLKEKGKVAGFLWMNKTDVSLENTPAVYMVYSPEGATKKFLNAETGIGYKALVKDISIQPESEDKAFIFSEYVKLMEKSGVYAINESSIVYGSVKKGMKEFSVTLSIPSKMTPGTYSVKALAVKNGTTVSETSEDLNLELTGLPATIAKLAYGSPLLFGFMAVFIAIATGLLIGMIFRGGGGAH